MGVPMSFVRPVRARRHRVQLVMGLVAWLQLGTCALQTLRFNREEEPLAPCQLDREVGEDIAGLDVVHIFSGPVKLGIFAGGTDIAAAVAAIAALDDKIAVLIVA